LDPRRFTDCKAGELIPVSGVPGISHAFIPNPLPPKWVWPERLWPLLVDARSALASLDGIGKHLPNPRLVLRPLQNREAQRSSSLEGTITDPKQQALFEVDPKYPRSSEDPVNAQREVFNYGKALRLRVEHKEELPLSLRLIRALHKILMDGVRGAEQDPGNFRRVQNQVGRPARFVPPPSTHLPEALDNFEKYLHADHTFDQLVEAFLVHYQFEAIHPFRDGNGRVGRLLLALIIAEWCELSNQWLYMSAYFDRNKDQYIDLMFRISTHGDWEQWIDFCLNGVIEQARDTEQRCERLLELNRSFHQKLKEIGGSVRLASIIDDLFNRPVTTVTQIQKQHAISYPTARSDLRKLEDAEIVMRLETYPQIAYYCHPIFAVTFDDPD
jgi:Fic family protein